MRLSRRLPDSTLLKRLALIGSGLVGVASALVLVSRARARGLQPRPDPATDYATGMERLQRLMALDDAAVNPVCRTRGVVHGHRTKRALGLIHGITSCPQQFAPLASQFFERGYNVVLARLPRHGLLDRTTIEPARLRAEELRTYADAVVDVAGGLGNEVIVVGLSAGGILAAWAAQHRPEVTTAVLIAPSFGLGHFGRWLQLTLMTILVHAPDIATH